MKLNYLLICILAALVLSCSDDGQFANAFLGATELKEGNVVPYILYQNYPNPFNYSTTIQYEVFMEMNLVLKVYTEDWIEVKTLVDGTHPPGQYAVKFNTKNIKISSGEFFYTLEGNNYIQVYKMKLLKQ
ncbi:MAG: hypothetical protein GXO77_00375 [Calditrichaeota bacterium]|nr:hypothetical protein [Calditrichota bacterium]